MILNLSNTLELTKTFSIYMYLSDYWLPCQVNGEIQNYFFLYFQFPNEEEVRPRTKCMRLGHYFRRKTMQIQYGLRWIMRKFWNFVSICLSSLDTKTYASID